MVHVDMPRITVLAGGGNLPLEVASSAMQAGYAVQVIGLADEADLSTFPSDIPSLRVEWGQIGRLHRALSDFQTDKLVIIGSIAKRPDHRTVRLDWGGVQMFPRLLATLLSGGDASVLDNVADLFASKGFTLVGAHDVAPDLVAREGHLAGPTPSQTVLTDTAAACRAAWMAGYLDMGQGAVAVLGRLVAMEGAEGTDGVLERVASMRSAKRFSTKDRTGVLAKCARPQQDMRLDMPTIGPRTIEKAAQAGLAAVAVEAGCVLVSQRGLTEQACKDLRITLLAYPRAAFVPVGVADRLAALPVLPGQDA